MHLLRVFGLDIEMIGKSLLIHSSAYSALSIADLHIGYEEALNKEGILMQRFQLAEMERALEKIFSILKKDYKIGILDEIIINGDLKHEFGKISSQEWRETLRMLELISGHAKKVIIVKGNHDNIMAPIAEKRKLELVASHKIGKILFTHGNHIPGKTELADIDSVIIGHEHPAVSIREGVRSEIFKCFLLGKWKGKNLIVMPSF
ncbi:MAG: metallophosphoesterase, partial [Candidatus Woesearchaeota archaeon]|nr:metallophosphoesterase [Candidatus Woesearchaeota archaeon]